MGKQNFIFNAITGTMEPVKTSVPVVASKPPKSAGNPVKLQLPSTQSTDNDNTQPLELSAGKEGIVQFKKLSDYSVFQIVDEDTGRQLAYIGGYGLDISFNMHELNSINKVEQCLEGLKKMFRNIILEQSFSNH